VQVQVVAVVVVAVAAAVVAAPRKSRVLVPAMPDNKSGEQSQ
jgi:hypothetical protein